MTHDSHSPPAPPPSPRRPVAEDEISLWEVLATVLRGRVLIVVTTVLVAAGSVATGFIGGNKFTSAAAFRPEGPQSGGSDIMALANQFGVDVGGGGDAASPAFYAELLKSREILLTVAEAQFDVAGVGRTTLPVLLEIEHGTPELDHEGVLRWLDEQAVSVSTARETGTVRLSVVTNWPDLSQAIAADLLDEVIRFNMATRQSRAASERKFAEARVDSMSLELLSAEDELQAFLESNRQWERAPLLRFQHDRLQRTVTMKQSVLTTLIQAYEQARIAERRDTPVITVIQQPHLPPRRDPRGTVMRGLVGVALGGVIGVLLAFLREAFRKPGQGDPAREDFWASWDAFVGSIPFMRRRRA